MKKAFGQLVKDLRKQKGWSVYALAQRVGLSDQAVSNLEQGAVPSFDTVRRLATVLEFSLDWIAERMPPVELPVFVPGRPRGRPPKSAPPATSPAHDLEATAKKRRSGQRKGK
jgi:transcriptional regulator with XRE-family HTH domain